MNLNRPLSEKEHDELESLMELRDPSRASVTYLHGFLTSVLSGPMIMPSEWIPVVLGDDSENGWENIEQAERAMTLLMRFYNEIATQLSTDDPDFSILVDRYFEGENEIDLAENWCRGYLSGVGMRADEWDEPMTGSEVHHFFLPIIAVANLDEEPAFDPFESPETCQEMLTALPYCAVEIHNWWRNKLTPHVETIRRDSPKISPNALCPCGSGKKYKRCCTPLRGV